MWKAVYLNPKDYPLYKPSEMTTLGADMLTRVWTCLAESRWANTVVLRVEGH